MVVGFSVGSYRDGQKKDTLRNIELTKDFVVYYRRNREYTTESFIQGFVRHNNYLNNYLQIKF